MTNEEIGARFVACTGWRWIPGMRAIRAIDDLNPKRLQHGSESTVIAWDNINFSDSPRARIIVAADHIYRLTGGVHPASAEVDDG